MEKLLVVEDAPDLRNQLKSELGSEYAILEGTDRADAMELFLKFSPKVVVLDLGLQSDRDGTAEGMHCLEWMIGMRPATKVVVLSSPHDQEKGYRALRRGAYDFHRKPVVPAELQVIIRRAFHLCSVEEQSCRFKETLERTTAGLEGIAGQCVALQRLFGTRQTVPFGEPQVSGEAADAGMMRCVGADLPGVVTSGGTEQVVQVGGAAQRAGTMLSSRRLTLREARDRVEKWMVKDAIGNCAGNLSKASELLGVSRPALYDLMKKYGICRSARG